MKYQEITEQILMCCFKVHNTLGNGFHRAAVAEVIYQRALEIEFSKNSIPFHREFEMPILYEGQHIGTRRVDFLVTELISVELKAVIKLENVHYAQSINYLEAYNLEIGMLINFGTKSLEYKRLTNRKFDSSINPNNP
jgi:GxxExxY protein